MTTSIRHERRMPETLRDFAIVAIASFCLLIVGIGNIRGEYSDEDYYLAAAREFIAGAPTSNTMHPPLAKYFLAASIKMLGENELAWRLPSVLAGTMLAVFLFGFVLKLTGETRTAYLAWLLTVAGGFWYMMSRVAMISIYELAFEVAAIWVFLVAIDNDDTRAWCGAGILFGLSVGCRWFGAMGLITCLGVAFYRLAFYRRRWWKPCAMGFVAFITYLVTWIPLLIREHRPARYLIAANLYIFKFHHGDPPVGHASDDWWTWFVPIDVPRSAPFVANPIIGALGLIAVAVLLYRRRDALPAWLYLANMLPWVLAVKPLIFYYYYFEAYTFLVVALAVATAGVTFHKVRVDFVVAAAAIGYFIYWYPTWGHFPPPFGGIFGYH